MFSGEVRICFCPNRETAWKAKNSSGKICYTNPRGRGEYILAISVSFLSNCLQPQLKDHHEIFSLESQWLFRWTYHSCCSVAFVFLQNWSVLKSESTTGIVVIKESKVRGDANFWNGRRKKRIKRIGTIRRWHVAKHTIATKSCKLVIQTTQGLLLHMAKSTN